ncbi:MAG: phosphoribosylamine--glycine ligase [Pseudarcicella sp.]|nr:phosphoribosylamine--glycine ligase [Pseudarcicella sp.]MBP6410184.1 phosphoribosylamine--glycine ligase [Pseudarcicella sp.]
MKVLIVGSGGREHAFAEKISQSPLCEGIFVAPGNAGTANMATNLNIGVNEFEKLGAACLSHKIELVIVGPEEPLVKGIRNYFEENTDLKHILIVGPDAKGAQIEGSKDFSKDFMSKYKIPTAKFKTFTKDTIQEGHDYLETQKTPIVLKADGLAAGKGVIIAQTLTEAKTSLDEMLLDAKFGDASSKVVIEEFLTGIELSVFVLTDGTSYKILPEAKDYKRIGEGDTGLNTGGMGAVSPVPFAKEKFMKAVENDVIIPTIEGLKKEGINYNGFIFIGLMNHEGEPQVIEYNARMGDPETEVVLPRIESDFLELMIATGKRTLKDVDLKISKQHAVATVLVAGGYPEAYKKGDVITGYDSIKEATIFHAGTTKEGELSVTNGGRVLVLTGMANTLEKAIQKSQKAASNVQFEGKYYRKDIGLDVLRYQ